MSRRTILAGGLALAVTPFVLAQEPTTPPVPEDALAPRELIAWSDLQTPQPAQDPHSPIQTEAREPNEDSAHRARSRQRVRKRSRGLHNLAIRRNPQHRIRALKQDRSKSGELDALSSRFPLDLPLRT